MTPAPSIIPTVETERLILRAPRREDFDAYDAFYSDVRSIFVGGPRTRFENWFTFLALPGHWALMGFGYWMIELRETGQVIGSAGIIQHLDWPEPELGWQLFEGFEGHGYATEAAIAARKWAAAQGMAPLVSFVPIPNDRSAMLAQRIGCQHQGTWESPFGILNVWRHPQETA
ncbi:MAG: GNAT family N-acetyltransferase [Paracoccus sp. (in: a-proteobacteria)]|uniref:GNAT family N-acetyltransferase n=1 Tax=Paracoccus sp. TaxID=267 RepID=UPI0026DFD741|nr:GNAT family N-acetyltransferase [Paracoccus sp. (in: a-proteobacteria)]MDO5630659.1 GNAT family N-acetyltransferase [Paracoccus sp. (in: a-proteobacteria)]